MSMPASDTAPSSRFFAKAGKLRAFLVHLALSASVVGTVGALMLMLWYPQPWFQHDGGWTVYRLILFVDVILGPLMTLLIFRHGKKGLTRDLSIIAAIQLGALAFGVTTMLQHRPVFLVHAEGNFFTVTWKEVRDSTRDLARLDGFRHSNGLGLPVVFLQLPADAARRAELRAAPRPISTFGDYYEPMNDERWTEVLRTRADIYSLASQDAGIKAELERFKSGHPQPLDEFVFLPVVCRDAVLMLVFERRSMTLVDWMN